MDLECQWSKHSGSNFKWKGDIKSCSCYRAVKLLQHGMNVVERVLEKGLI